MRRIACTLIFAAIAAIALAGPARADQRIVAGPPTRYVTPSVTIDQGEHLTFLNQDTVAHDVTARDDGPDGKPLFRTDTIGTGKEVAVDGSQYLTAGSYRFFCTVHPNMEGTLTVTSNGTPAPKPGAPPTGGGGAPPAGGRDTTPPSVTVGLEPARRSVVLRAHALAVSVASDEAADVTVSATLRSGRRRAALHAATTSFAAGGTQTVTLSLSRTALRAVRRGAVVSLSATAVDRAGNRATARAAGRLR